MAGNVAKPIYSIRYDYAENLPALDTWSQVVEQLPATATLVEIVDTGGSVMSLGLGASGEETEYFKIPAGGNSPPPLPVFIPTLSRLSIMPLDVAPTEGSLVINFYED